MPAFIEEVKVLNVVCPDPGCLREIADGITSRTDAEFLVQSHDATWHAPILEDVAP